MAENLNREQRTKVSIEVRGTECELSPEVKLVLFRIAQEALNNVKKHSGATKAVVKLEYAPQKITVMVTDDGKGFELPERLSDLASLGKLGLTGMEERARLLGGTLKVQSKLGQGTTITAELPLSAT